MINQKNKKEPKLTVLVYNGDLQVPTFVYKLGEQLLKRNHHVTIMGQSDAWFTFRENGIIYYPLPSPTKPTWLLFSTLICLFKVLVKSPLAIPSIFETMKDDYNRNKGIKGGRNWLLDFIRLAESRQIQPDVIHNQWSPLLVALEPLFPFYPIVQSLHGRLVDITPFHNQAIANIYQKFYPMVSGFQSASQQLLNNASHFGASTSNTKVTYSLVEKAQIQKHHFPAYLKTEQLNIISIGKLAWRKGYGFALDAMKILKDQGIGFQYHIVCWDDPTEIKFHIAELELEEYVTLYFSLPHDQTLKQLQQADLFLLPSVEEGFATVVTEAMALEIPVISTNCGGMGELIKDGENGWLIPSRNANALVDAINHFRKLPSKKLQTITDNALRLVNDRLTWEKQIDQLISLYQNSLV